ncbi:hypothetical protein TcG_04143 [Trypanosoma cruzi]|nr:hypothetical protein TcG_04143 [Trypanosoma cruzi]
MSGRGSKTGRELSDSLLLLQCGLRAFLPSFPVHTNQLIQCSGIHAGGQSAVREMCGFKQHQYSGGTTKYAMVPFAGDVARFTVDESTHQNFSFVLVAVINCENCFDAFFSMVRECFLPLSFSRSF